MYAFSKHFRLGPDTTSIPSAAQSGIGDSRPLCWDAILFRTSNRKPPPRAVARNEPSSGAICGRPATLIGHGCSSGLFALLLLLGVATVSPAHASVLQLDGRGVQIYRCTSAGNDFSWMLVAPEATLRDTDGRVAARHFAGPSWQALDGSVIRGVVVASEQVSDAIPWLIVRAVHHAGRGAFRAVGYVVRSGTSGGLAPSAGCDAAHTGLRRRVAYSATYTFYGAS